MKNSIRIEVKDGGTLTAVVILPVSEIAYVLYEYDPARSSPLSPKYNPNFPYGHAVYYFLKNGVKWGELFETKEEAEGRLRLVKDSLDGWSNKPVRVC